MTNTELAMAIANDLAAHDRNDAARIASRTSRRNADPLDAAMDAYRYVMARRMTTGEAK